MTITSCNTLRQRAASDAANQRNWQCEFLYHQENNLPKLIMATERILAELYPSLAKIQRDIARALRHVDQSDRPLRLAKDSHLRATIVGGVNIDPIANDLRTLRQMVIRQEYLLHQDALTSIRPLIDQLVAMRSPWELVYMGRVRLASVDAKLLNALRSVRWAIRRTCNPELSTAAVTLTGGQTL